MSDDHRPKDLSAEPLEVPESSLWARLPIIGLVIGVLGLGASVVLGQSDRAQLTHSSHVAFMFFISLAFGGLFFVILHYVTKAGWSVTLRRVAENVAGTFPLFIVLFIPIALNLNDGFHWAAYEHLKSEIAAHPEVAESLESAIAANEGLLNEIDEHPERAGELAEVAALAQAVEGNHALEEAFHHNPMAVVEAAEGDHLLDHKSAWLNRTGFFIRAGLYLLVLSGLALFFMRSSRRQDETGDYAVTRRLQNLSTVSMIVFALTLTAVAFDWLMSVEPHWYSTVFGVYYFAGCVICCYATLSVLFITMKRTGLIRDAVNKEHFHDLGKMLFAFIVFWTYIAFSQYMLIWYANMPEETVWYRARWEGSWSYVSVLLAVGHFAVPFFFLMSRHIKRRTGLLLVGAVWMLLMHLVDMYWLVMPPFHSPGGEAGVHLHILDLTTLIGVGGLWLAMFAWNLRGVKLIPVRDPRLPEALAFENF